MSISDRMPSAALVLDLLALAREVMVRGLLPRARRPAMHERGRNVVDFARFARERAARALAAHDSSARSAPRAVGTQSQALSSVQGSIDRRRRQPR